ncbi:putative glycosyl transferase domain protein [Burkholderia pseudomallei MSHR2990]|nr:putative glycosyl transferase domain protein [Burkholderia pseudomallei MSHR465J]KGW75892.1 putative glycosyl transferase domain protein [Burkholderia pseudomallei MSHR2990]
MPGYGGSCLVAQQRSRRCRSVGSVRARSVMVSIRNFDLAFSAERGLRARAQCDVRNGRRSVFLCLESGYATAFDCRLGIAEGDRHVCRRRGRLGVAATAVRASETVRSRFAEHGLGDRCRRRVPACRVCAGARFRAAYLHVWGRCRPIVANARRGLGIALCAACCRRTPHVFETDGGQTAPDRRRRGRIVAIAYEVRVLARYRSRSRLLGCRTREAGALPACAAHASDGTGSISSERSLLQAHGGTVSQRRFSPRFSFLGIW